MVTDGLQKDSTLQLSATLTAAVELAVTVEPTWNDVQQTIFAWLEPVSR